MARRLWWRCCYAVCFSPIAAALTMIALRAYRAARGSRRAGDLLGALEMRLAYSGWPHHERGWVNLHASRWISGVRRRWRRSTRTPKRAPADVMRIGCVGRFSGLLGFPPELFAACPAELIVADIAFRGQHLAALRRHAAVYDAFDLDGDARYEVELDRIAQLFRTHRVELLVNVGAKQDALDVLDRIDVPCVANLCASSDLLHHPAVDVQLFGQPQADYFVRDRRMFCGTTGTFLSDQFVHEMTGFMDARGLRLGPAAPWARREPLIVCHGSIYKFAREPFLKLICQLLADDRSLRLVLMGKDDGDAVARIMALAARWNVREQVDYLGQFSAVRNAAGEIADTGWRTLVDLLGRARLAPNPFPLGGGSARFEAYILGTPTVHLGVRFDRDAWGRPQPSTCEIPSLLTASGTARSIDEYRLIAARCLSDGAFADALAAEQLQLARVLADAPRWWRDVLDGYRLWMQQARRTA